MVKRHRTHVVVGLRITAVVHVAKGEHPVRLQRQFQQCKSPVALVAGGGKVLQLAAQSGLTVKLVLTLADEDVGVYHAALAFYGGLVVALVHIHEVQLETLRELLVQLYVQVLIVRLVAPFPERRAVAVGAGVARAVGVLLYGVHVREVHLDARAVLAAQEGVALKAVAHFCLVSPLAEGLCGVGV